MKVCISFLHTVPDGVNYLYIYIMTIVCHNTQLSIQLNVQLVQLVQGLLSSYLSSYLSSILHVMGLPSPHPDTPPQALSVPDPSTPYSIALRFNPARKL